MDAQATIQLDKGLYKSGDLAINQYHVTIAPTSARVPLSRFKISGF